MSHQEPTAFSLKKIEIERISLKNILLHKKFYDSEIIRVIPFSKLRKVCFSQLYSKIT